MSRPTVQPAIDPIAWASEKDRLEAEFWPKDKTQYWLLFDAADLRALAAGLVPAEVHLRIQKFL